MLWRPLRTDTGCSGGHGSTGSSGGHGSAGSSGGHGGAASVALTSSRPLQPEPYNPPKPLPAQRKSLGKLLGLNSWTGTLPGQNKEFWRSFRGAGTGGCSGRCFRGAGTGTSLGWNDRYLIGQIAGQLIKNRHMYFTMAQ